MLEIVTSSIVVFRSLGGLKMFGENAWENLKFILVKQLCPDSINLFFIFTRFNAMPLILLVKANLNSDFWSVKGE